MRPGKTLPVIDVENWQDSAKLMTMSQYPSRERMGSGILSSFFGTL
jgi:hypothetical protein